MKKVVQGKAIAPYSPAVIYDGKLVFTAGQIPDTAEVDVGRQARQALEKLQAVLEKAGAGLETVLKVTAFLTDMNDFAVFNEVYAGFFPVDPPARSAIGVASLPLGVKVEVEAIAYKRDTV